MMIVVGIVGGIASGKSLITHCFKHFGATVLDGDQIGHQVLQTSEVKQLLVARWGQRILEGEDISRSGLAQIVFGPAPDGPNALAELEQVMHPRIGARIMNTIDLARQDSTCQVCVLDAPVMVKSGWHKFCDKIVFVEADLAARLERAKRRNWDDNELTRRELNQVPLGLKRELATDSINNSGSIESTFQQAVETWLGWGCCVDNELVEFPSLKIN